MPKRFLKFSDRWMFNRVLCEEEVCRKVLRAALGIEVGEIAYLNAEQAKEPAAAALLPDSQADRPSMAPVPRGSSFLNAF